MVHKSIISNIVIHIFLTFYNITADMSYCFIGNLDYFPGPFVVTIPAGATSVPFNVIIADDHKVEANETFSLSIDYRLLHHLLKRIYPYSCYVTINDDDCESLMFHYVIIQSYIY